MLIGLMLLFGFFMILYNPKFDVTSQNELILWYNGDLEEKRKFIKICKLK